MLLYVLMRLSAPRDMLSDLMPPPPGHMNIRQHCLVMVRNCIVTLLCAGTMVRYRACTCGAVVQEELWKGWFWAAEHVVLKSSLWQVRNLMQASMVLASHVLGRPVVYHISDAMEHAVWVPSDYVSSRESSLSQYYDF